MSDGHSAMSGNVSNGPMLKATGLWAKTNVKGGQYLTGRLGGLKVLVMENRDRQGDDEPSHILYFAEAPPRQEPRQGVQERGDGPRAPQTPLAGQRPSQPQRNGVQGHAGGDGPALLHPDGRARSAVGKRFEDGPPWEW